MIRLSRKGATARVVHHAWCALAAFGAVLVPSSSTAQTIEYLLRPVSQIRRICTDCPDGEKAAQPLSGTFDLTVMPIPEAYAIEAITGVHWNSPSFRITGAGFLERLGRDRISMVVDARVNDQQVLLASAAHPTAESGGDLRLTLMSPPDSPVAIEIEVVAFANRTDGPDIDADGIPDSLDLCPRVPDDRQSDADLDGLGDPCDVCPGSLFGEAVLPDGCSVEQACPCAGPRTGMQWQSQKEYVTCVARALKFLAETEEITREQARRMVQAAVSSGCGMPAIARVFVN